jgi:hypothetical protein
MQEDLKAREGTQEKNTWVIKEVDFLPCRVAGSLYGNIIKAFIEADMAIGKVTVKNKSSSALMAGLKNAVRRMGLSQKVVVRRIKDETFLINAEKSGIIPLR